MQKIKVSKGTCIGCGACAQIDPDHFEIDDNGFSEVVNEVPSEITNEAVDSCPVSAISILESEECSCDDCHCDECDCEDCDCEDCDCEDCDCEDCDCEDCDCEDCHCNEED